MDEQDKKAFNALCEVARWNANLAGHLMNGMNFASKDKDWNKRFSAIAIERASAMKAFEDCGGSISNFPEVK
jgi:hypothetical protein